ncbi:MAG: lasso peptide biosynthesis PqqD family chaperone [Candidatus Ozemobacteraceae bacterium]
MRNISLDSIITLKKEIVTADLDSETVMMSVETGKYYSLGKMGSNIWRIIEDSITVENLVLKLLEKYQVTRLQCEAEVLSFLNETYKEGLIEIK